MAFVGTTPLNFYSVSNIAALRALQPNLSPIIFVQGYYAPGDGGGGNFYWSQSSSTLDNGGTVIKPSSVSGSGRWLRPTQNFIFNVAEFGAIGDGATNYAANLNACFAAASASVMPAKVIIPPGNYIVGTTQIAWPDCVVDGGDMNSTTITSSLIGGSGTATSSATLLQTNSTVKNITIACPLKPVSGNIYSHAIGFNNGSYVAPNEAVATEFLLDHVRAVGWSNPFSLRTTCVDEYYGQAVNMPQVNGVCLDCEFDGQINSVDISVYGSGSAATTAFGFWPLFVDFYNCRLSTSVYPATTHPVQLFNAQSGYLRFFNCTANMVQDISANTSYRETIGGSSHATGCNSIIELYGGSYQVNGGTANPAGGPITYYSSFDNSTDSGTADQSILRISGATAYDPNFVLGWDNIQPTQGSGSPSAQTDVNLSSTPGGLPGMYIGQRVYSTATGLFHTCTAPSSAQYILTWVPYSGAIIGGTFTLTLGTANGQTTTATIPYNATTSQVLSALQGLPNVGTGSGITVSGTAGPTGPMTITIPPTVMGGAYANLYVTNQNLVYEFGNSGGQICMTGPQGYSTATWITS